MKNDELSSEVTSEVTTLRVELARFTKEHKVVVSRISADHEGVMAMLKRKQEEAFEGFKKNTLKILSNITLEYKSNVLLHIQVAAGPFDVHKVGFDALYEVEMYQLSFDVRYPSRAAWEKFLSKWKNTEDFYLEGSLCNNPKSGLLKKIIC